MTTAQFIIDCGVASGLGHLRRSLVLASALRSRCVECNIHITSDVGLHMLEHFNFRRQSNFGEILQPVDLLIVDGNSFTKRQIETWARSAKLLCIIDDNALRPVCCDILINPNLYAKIVSYEHYRVSSFLFGPDYHLVADEFFVEKSDKRKSIDYLISFGGSDDGELAVPVIEKLIESSNHSTVWAVPFHIKPKTYILDLARCYDNFSIVVDGDISVLFSQTKCFIGGAGAMVLEALASGCNIIACAVVPDQDRNIEYLRGHNIAAFPQFDADKIILAAKQLHGPNTALAKLEASGPYKIADVILKELGR